MPSYDGFRGKEEENLPGGSPHTLNRAGFFLIDNPPVTITKENNRPGHSLVPLLI